MRVSVLSKEYVRVPISATEDGAPVDPTADTVQMAVAAAGVAPTFVAAEWETSGTTFYARVLIGPGSTIGSLAVGYHDVWVKITDNPEIPAVNAGNLQVY